MGSKQSKIRPIHEPLGNSQFDTRMFKPVFKGKHKPGAPRHISVFPCAADKVDLYFFIKYTPTWQPSNPSLGGPANVIINGNEARISPDVASALEAIYTHGRAINGLTNGWTPCYFLAGLCVNHSDPAEAAKQAALASYIESAATFVLDLTGPKARILSGAVAYTAPVVNIDGSLASSMMALDNALANAERVKGHRAGNLVWAEP